MRMRKKKNTVYCIYCGEENTKWSIWCKKCKKILYSQRHPFVEFLFGNALDNVTDGVSDSIFNLIKNFLLTHLYGISLAASIIFTTTAFVINNLNDKTSEPVITHVSEKLVLKESNLCKDIESKDQVYTCPNGYTLKDQECIKTTRTKAKENNSCDEGYEYVNQKCVSKETFESIKSYTCGAPSGWTLDTKVWNDENPTGAPITITSKDIWWVACKSRSLSNGDARLQCSGPDDSCIAGWCYPGKLVDKAAGEEYFYDKSRHVDCLDGGTTGYAMTVKESCPSGTSSINGSCKKTREVHRTYSCETGKLNNNMCEKEEKIEAESVCPDGYTFSQECNKCIVSES